jgi:hypothetical protein
MSDIEQAALRLEGEAIRQRGYWRSKPQTVLVSQMYWFWDYVANNSLALIELSILQRDNIINLGEYIEQHR